MAGEIHRQGNKISVCAKRIPNVCLATGTVMSLKKGYPNVWDMALGLGKECRYGGGVRRFWPVLLHTFVVCDLVPDDLKFPVLMHDGVEVAGGDRPKPFKTPRMEREEDRMSDRLFRGHGARAFTRKEYIRFKWADRAAVRGEVWTVGPPGLAQMRYKRRMPEVERLIRKYCRMYSAADCVRTGGGKAAREFVRRYHEYKKLYGKAKTR